MASEVSSNCGVKIPTFSGTVGESAKFWLAKFEQVMKLRKVKNEEAVQGNYGLLTKAFRDRFLPSELDRVVNVSHFRGFVQRKGESTQSID